MPRPSRRAIPSIEQLRQRQRVRALEARFGRDAVVEGLRAEAETLRGRLASAETVPDPANEIDTPAGATAYLERALEHRLARTFQSSLRGVINATGVIVHTNLGRAPLASRAAARVAELATGYSNLEYDLQQGARGARDVHAEALLCRLTGAEAAVVVNNNAAATLVALAALAGGREVIISRGELIEIGGGFRIPDVMAQSGALLREVGTTNRTRVADYAAAIGDRTAMILRVHRSNFRIEGFTEQPRLEELVALGHRFDILVAEDLGSGSLLAWNSKDHGSAPLIAEPQVQASVAAGVDLVCFSGDKLLGGPQAGIIVGRRAALARVRTHPLMRALRVDKMTYAALEATLLEYALGRAAESVPVARMIALSTDEIARRARVVADRLRGNPLIATTILDGVSTVGGGSAPGSAIPTKLLALCHASDPPDVLDGRLRQLDPPVVARIEHDRVVLDLRTVLPEQDEVLAQLLLAVAGGASSDPQS